MPKAKKMKRTQRPKETTKPKERIIKRTQLPKANLPFSTINYVFFGIGFLLLIVGYYFLAQPASDPDVPPAEGFLSLNIAPILLFAAYIIVFPLTLILKKKKTSETANR